MPTDCSNYECPAAGEIRCYPKFQPEGYDNHPLGANHNVIDNVSTIQYVTPNVVWPEGLPWCEDNSTWVLMNVVMVCIME